MKRKDGRKIKTLDPFFRIIPMVMTTRTECSNHCHTELATDTIERFIKRRKSEGVNYSYMSVVITAYMRAVCAHPELNRFVVNRRIYARHGFSVSFVMLKESRYGQSDETAVKVQLNLDDTLAEVHAKLEKVVEENRAAASSNITDKLVKAILGVPLLPGGVVRLFLWADRHGLLPKSVIEASPFHTGLFFTNLASINLDFIYHHLYEFGTCSTFLALGRRKHVHTPSGERTFLPLGVVADDRICGGITWARSQKTFFRILSTPELLEQKPERVEKDLI